MRQVALRIEQQRYQRRHWRHDLMPERASQSVATAVAAALRQRLPAGGQHDLPGLEDTAGGIERKAIRPVRQRLHAAAVQPFDAELRTFREQRLQHIARPVRVGKQLAVRLFVQGHAEVGEELHGLRHWQRAQHLADGRARTAVEVALRNRGVGDVAAAAAAHQDLRAWSPGTINQPHARRAIGACGRKWPSPDRRRRRRRWRRRVTRVVSAFGASRKPGPGGRRRWPARCCDRRRASHRSAAPPRRRSTRRTSWTLSRSCILDQRLRQQQRGHVRIVP